ncbi:two pore domain potassium channel family protein [Apibacter muscae]|uniref:Two pore domain potassium channel family protein n=1 Tax=Apibacter muscae TaxID=2509004 RepID=A0A563DG26_9FLAO|nr:ion channel [Apibacter muscae]TWP29009.1 two pore domain potassium channel family protein [Apibacter muscae]
MNSSNLLEKYIKNFLQISILLLSVFLVVSMSIDIFRGIDTYAQNNYLKIQYWICLWFLFSFFIEIFLSENRWKYFKTHFIFLIISIPYQNIIYLYHIQLPSEAMYLIRFIPLLRGGYALAIVVGWFTNNKISSLFITYLSMLMATVYFSSLAFYAIEYTINPQINGYGDAIWWAFMNVTTVGSNIVAISITGKVLTVLLAAIGMMMFPIFTIYLTNLITTKAKELGRE